MFYACDTGRPGGPGRGLLSTVAHGELLVVGDICESAVKRDILGTTLLAQLLFYSLWIFRYFKGKKLPHS